MSGSGLADRARWAIVAVLLFLPITAIAHHRVFYPQMCILNPFGPRYDLPTVAAWLRFDWSPYVGAASVAVVYLVGLRYRLVRTSTLAFVIATLPLSIWLWDLPFGDRPICNWWHDGRIIIGSRHLYGLALVAWPLLMLKLRTRERHART